MWPSNFRSNWNREVLVFARVYVPIHNANCYIRLFCVCKYSLLYIASGRSTTHAKIAGSDKRSRIHRLCIHRISTSPEHSHHIGSLTLRIYFILCFYDLISVAISSPCLWNKLTVLSSYMLFLLIKLEMSISVWASRIK